MNFSAIFCIFIFLPLFVSAAVIPDPEFAIDPGNWLLSKNLMRMMKDVPEGSNYTLKEYYESWNMDFEAELAKLEITGSSTDYMNKELEWLRENDHEFLIDFHIYIGKCSKFGHFEMEQFDRSHIKNLTLSWSGKYCGSPTVLSWCANGYNLRLDIEDVFIVDASTYMVNFSAECPFSLYQAVNYFFYRKIEATKHSEEHWVVKWQFYVIAGILIFLLFCVIGIVAVKVCEKRHRKLSRLALEDQRRRVHLINAVHAARASDEQKKELELLQNGAIFRK